MITVGNPYPARGEDAKERNIRKRRAVYSTTGTATSKQRRIIDKIEKGLTNGDWSGDPNHTMYNAECAGIEFWEEELRADGKWHRVEDLDTAISLMQTGAL